jgi:ArsR family transcriptional regulator, arsenate/arsenite/antimonite-responsive transcriptional repressor
MPRPTQPKTLADRCGASPTAGCCPGGSPLKPQVSRDLARLFKALGDETRLEMVGLLAAAGGALCACDIESRFDLSQPTVSHHLRLLKEAGLVLAERRGTWVFYTLEPKTLRRVAAMARMLEAGEGDDHGE